MIFNILAILVLVYSVVIELQMLLLAGGSYLELSRNRFVARYRRVEDLLSSDAMPPVSIIMPAYNEAAGIVESVRSMQMLKYPKFEIVVINDGSTDDTLQILIDEFRLIEVTMPYRAEIESEPVLGLYQSTLPIPLVVVDKVNGKGKADAVNAGINAAKYPYVLITDADIVLDEYCVLRTMRYVVEDRVRTVAVGGNIRPINGCEVGFGRVTNPHIPKRLVERMQLLEYLRSFVAARPAWSRINSLVFVSGGYGVYRRDVVTAVGGQQRGHLGEDLDLSMRVHRYLRQNKVPYRFVYAPEAVAWTEVPSTWEVLRTQRIRWHRGLTQAVGDFFHMVLNPRYGQIGLLGWSTFFFVEFLAPLIEFIGWFVLPIAYLLGFLNLSVALPLLGIWFFLGVVNSLLALYLDESFGYFNSPLDATRLLVLAFIENFGLRQRTVWWRVRSFVGRKKTPVWGDMQRVGVSNLGSQR